MIISPWSNVRPGNSVAVWPEPVEQIAAFLRASGATGRLEELPADADTAPGPAVHIAGFECDGRALVALVPEERTVDRDKLARSAGCRALRPSPASAFPFRDARVFLERTLLPSETVWLEAGAERFVLGLPPADVVRLTRAEAADLLLEA
jgi:prolyl-tRNA editing enzyme YbaK/EbsC (Cys-tRNA(Pro) deacylase)